MENVEQPLQLVIVTGMSGAGKTQALKCLEDLGFFCVDNLPPTFIPKMAELFMQTGSQLHRLALGIDIRGGSFFGQVMEALQVLEEQGVPYGIVYLEAQDEVLIRRYKESRHRHPLSGAASIQEALGMERQLLHQLRERATFVIDTSYSSIQELRHELTSRLAGREHARQLVIHILTFGFKRGLPLDADLVFDVRFLPNPHYVEALKERTGRDPDVQDYVYRWGVTRKFFRRLTGLIGFLLPLYAAEGKTQLTIAIGCTGGQHRSVAIGTRLAEWLRQRGYKVTETHRDCSRPRAGDT